MPINFTTHTQKPVTPTGATTYNHSNSYVSDITVELKVQRLYSEKQSSISMIDDFIKDDILVAISTSAGPNDHDEQIRNLIG